MSFASRILLTPVLLGFAALIPFIVPEWNLGRVLLAGVLMSGALAFTLGMWLPRQGAWALRFVGLLIFLLFAAYAVDEFFFSGHRFTLAVRKSERAPWNALLGLVIIGLPSLAFALSGKGSLLELFIRRDREEPPK